MGKEILAKKVDFVIEISSEAARKVGGIYTVLQSKSGKMVELFGDNYLLIGLYDPYVTKGDFFEEEPPAKFQRLFKEVEPLGIKCYYGRWVTGNDTKVILIDPSAFGERRVGNDKQINLIKYELWKNFGIDSLFMGWDFNRNVSWAYSAGIVVEKILQDDSLRGKNCVVHCHEWISGAALLYLKKKNINAGLVFTTHATSLGRAKVASGEDLIKEVSEGLNSGRMVDVQDAYKFKIEGQHLLEKACAENCDVFTTVSDVIAKEAEYMFGRKSDVITPNAIDFNKLPSESEVRYIAQGSREEIQKLCYSIFLPYYKVNPRDSLFIYLSGRYEFYNKGIDLYIKALAKLDHLLRKENSQRDIFAFIFVPTNVSKVKEEICDNLLIINKITSLLKMYKKDVNLISNLREIVEKSVKLAEGEKIDVSEYAQFFIDLPRDIQLEIVKLYRSLKKTNEKPPIECFELSYPNDQILNGLRSLGLDNSPQNKVKVVFYPTYLKPGDGLLHMEYWEVISAFDVGIFPSRYEPWGYTPVEAATMLNLAMTSDRAGFGRYILNNFGKRDSIVVIPMVGKKEEEIVDFIANQVVKISKLEREKLEKLKVEARSIVESCDWEKQIQNYLKAYELSIERKEKRIKSEKNE